MVDYPPHEAQLWRALSHPKRRQIVQLLRESPLTTGKISDHFDVSRYAVMKHLKVLEDAGLIHARREGRYRWNVLNESLLDRLEADAWRDLSGSSPEERAAGMGENGPVDAIEPKRLEIIEVATLAASVERVYVALTKDIDGWWGYRVCLDASRVVLEDRLNGRFYETMEPDGGYLFGNVTALQPGSALWLSGPIFWDRQPLFSQARIELGHDQRQTLVRVTHILSEPDEPDAFEFYRDSWREALMSLKGYVEERANGG